MPESCIVSEGSLSIAWLLVIAGILGVLCGLLCFTKHKFVGILLCVSAVLSVAAGFVAKYTCGYVYGGAFLLAAIFVFCMKAGKTPQPVPAPVPEPAHKPEPKPILSDMKGGDLSRVHVGLGWRASEDPNVNFDLDLLAYTFTEEGSLKQEIEAKTDNTRGSSGIGDNDDETIKLDFRNLSDVGRILITVTAKEQDGHLPTFAELKKAFVRIVDAEESALIKRYELPDIFGSDTAAICGELIKAGAGWKFKNWGVPVSEGFSALLSDVQEGFGVLCEKYGITH